MNRREAIEAMLRGETVRNECGQRYRFTDEGGFQLFDEDGWRNVLTALRGEYELAPPPNPHPFGTWHWAGVEYARGKTVTRSGRPPWNNLDGYAWHERSFRGEDFTATDLEVVP